MANKKSSERKDSRKSSSDISEKSAPSPDEKKSRNEPSEEGEDEVLTEVNVAEDLKVRLDQNIPQLSALEKKLDKLGVIKLEIQKVNAKISKLESNVNTLQCEIAQLKIKHNATDKCACKL